MVWWGGGFSLRPEPPPKKLKNVLEDQPVMCFPFFLLAKWLCFICFLGFFLDQVNQNASANIKTQPQK